MGSRTEAISLRPRRFRQNTIAVVYDFDGTLTPRPMQEYTVLPQLGLESKAFWKEVNDATRRSNGDPMLTYLRILLEKVEQDGRHLTRAELRAMADDIEYFPGVSGWFGRVNAYVRARGGDGIRVRHYIVSAGHKEILDGIGIRDQVQRVFASEYFFNRQGRATFPKVVINDTQKTQCLFRINKGRERISESINEYMPEAERPVPFQNMIYVGDGLTDVPCMTVAKKNGGYALAVHSPGDRRGIEECRKLLEAGRVDLFAAADYRQGKKLERRFNLLLDTVIARILYEKEAFANRRGE